MNKKEILKNLDGECKIISWSVRLQRVIRKNRFEELKEKYKYL